MNDDTPTDPAETDPPLTATGWSNRCHRLREEYEATGDPAVLDAAIEAGRTAMGLTPPDHPWWARRLSNLSLALRVRSELIGRIRDLVESIALAEQAVVATASDAPWRALLQSNLASALRARYALTSEQEDLHRAADLDRDALAMVDADEPDRPGILGNLGATYLELFHASRDRPTLEAALTSLTAAASATAPDDPDLPRYLMNLAVAARDWAELTGKVETAEHAIIVGERAYRLLPPGHPELSGCLSDLGRAHRVRATLTPQGSDRQIHLWQGVALRRRASSVTTAPYAARALAARAWGEWSLEDGDPSTAADGYTTAVGLLAGVAWHGLERRGREVLLARWRGLSEDAAASALLSDRPSFAVILLEQGRTVLWNGSLNQLEELSALEKALPIEAGRLRAIRRLLDGGLTASE